VDHHVRVASETADALIRQARVDAQLVCVQPVEEHAFAAE
jgi:hypothetical protein